ncbi:Ig-like domain-containing protein [Gallibacterium melopsittaci]|uniref:Ig-like domain-containing protein n=1 Tax=Gallibacterium melopsittaci TaxID=516063 RepID=A0ABV6HUK4_9PAST
MSKTIILNINNSKETIQTLKLEKGQLIKIKAQAKVHYQFTDEETQFAPENIMTKRVGDDLVIAFEGSDIEQPDLIIEDYYNQENNDCLLVGQYENGQIYPYVPESTLQTDAVTLLADGNSAGQALGGDPISNLWAFSPWWLLALLPLAAGIQVNHSDSGVAINVTVVVPNPTKNNTPEITGETNAPEGSTVTITITDSEGNTQTVTTTVNPDGSYNVEVPNELPEGNFNVVVEVTTPDGNSGKTNGNGEIDTTPPTVDATEIANDKQVGQDTGDTDNYSYVNKQEKANGFTISGNTAEDTKTVVVEILKEDGTTTGTSYTATVDNGTWTANVPANASWTDNDGTYQVKVTATDKAGNTNTDIDLTVVDTTPPTVTVDAPDITTNKTPTIKGNVTDVPEGTTVTVIVTDKDGNTQTVTTKTDENGDYSIEVPNSLPEGNYDVEVEVEDPAGNKGVDKDGNKPQDKGNEVVKTNVTLDPITPDDVINKEESQQDIPISGKVTGEFTEGDKVTVTVNNKPFTTTVEKDGSFTVNVPGKDLAEADQPKVTATVEVTDKTGSKIPVETDRDYAVDTTPPDITVNVPSTTKDTTPEITGTTDAPAGSTITVTITDKDNNTQTVTTTVNPDGSYSVEVPKELPEGNYNVTVEVTDPAGNTGTNNGNGEIDLTPPNITVNVPSTTKDTTPEITGTTDAPAGSTITVTITDKDNNTQTVTTTVNPDGSYSVEVPNELPEGNYNVTVEVTDPAGNTGTNNGNGEIDLTPPNITVNVPSTTKDTTPEIIGTTDAPAGSTITVTITDKDNNTQTVTTTVNPDGSYSVEVPNELPEGNYNVTVEVTDPAGNTGTDNGNGEIDLTPPTVDTTEIANDKQVGQDTGDTDNYSYVNKQEKADGFTISGNTAEDTETVVVEILKEDGTTTGTSYTATVENGSWTAKVLADEDWVKDGTYQVKVTATDKAGNTNTDIDLTVVDTTPPNSSTTNITITTIGGDDVINKEEAGSPKVPVVGKVTGEFKEGDTVTVTVNGNPYTDTVDKDGNFTINVPGKELVEDNDKTIEISITTTDDAGNTATVEGTPKTYTVDTSVTIDINHIAGEDQGDTDKDGYATINIKDKAEGFKVSGTTDAEDGQKVTVTVKDSTGSTVATYTEAATVAGGNWSMQVPANEDWITDKTVYTFTAKITDKAGNTTEDPDKTAETDLTAPSNDTTTITLNPITPDNIINQEESGKEIPVSGKVTGEFNKGDTVTVTVNNNPYTGKVDEEGNFSIKVPGQELSGAEPPKVTATIEVTDKAGNPGKATTEKDYDVDITPPTVDVTHIAGDEQVGADSGNEDNYSYVNSTEKATGFEIKGSTDATDVSSVIVEIRTQNGDKIGDGVTYTATVENGTWTANVPADADWVKDGTYQVIATATDKVGNTNTDIDLTVVDLTPPNSDTTQVTITTVGYDDVINKEEADSPEVPVVGKVTGEFTEGDTVTVTVNNNPYTGKVDKDGNFTIKVPGSALDNDSDKQIEVEVEASDKAGNKGKVPGSPKTYTVDKDVSIDINHIAGEDQNGADADGYATINNTDKEKGFKVSGTTDAEQGQTVTVTVSNGTNEVARYTATVEEAGKWSVNVPANETWITDKTVYTFTAKVTDKAGNTAEDPDKTAETNLTLPNVTVTVNKITDDNVVNKTESEDNITITGKVTSPDVKVGDKVVVTVDGNKHETSVKKVTDGQGEFEVTVSGSELKNASTPKVTATATVTNTAGNEGTGSGEQSYTVDTTATIDITHIAGEDQGDTDKDGYATINIKDKADGFKVSGTTDAEDGQKVTVTVKDSGGSTVATYTDIATVSGGSWSMQVPAGQEWIKDQAVYTFTATVTDTAGNTAEDSDSTAATDLTPPTVSVMVDNVTEDNVVNKTESSGKVTITGKVNSPDVKVGDDVTVTVNGKGYPAKVTSVSNNEGNFSVEVDGSELASANPQTVTATATVTDPSGNPATGTGTKNYTVDTTAPVIDINQIAGELQSGDDQGDDDSYAYINSSDKASGFTISGTTDAENDQTVSIKVYNTDDASNPVATYEAKVANGAWTANVPANEAWIEDGKTYNFTATVSDKVGNEGRDTDKVNADLTKPAVDVNHIAGDDQPSTGDTGNTDKYSYVNKAEKEAGFTIKGSTETGVENVIVEILKENGDQIGNGVSYTAPVKNGTWTVDVPANATWATDGTYQVKATATDKAGNTNTDIDLTVVDTTAPTISITVPATSKTPKPTITGTVTGVEPGTEVTVTITYNNGSTQTVTTTTDSSGNYSVVPDSNLPSGDYTATAKVKDPAGNEANSNSGTGNVDLTAKIDITEIAGETQSEAAFTDNSDTNQYASISDSDNANGFAVKGKTDVGAGQTVTLEVIEQAKSGLSVQADGTYAPTRVVKTYTTTTDTNGDWTINLDKNFGFSQGRTYQFKATVTSEYGATATDIDVVTTAMTATVDITTINGYSQNPIGTDANDYAIIDSNAKYEGLTISGTSTNAAGRYVSISIDGKTFGTYGISNVIQNDGNWTITIPGIKDLTGRNSLDELDIGIAHDVTATIVDLKNNGVAITDTDKTRPVEPIIRLTRLSTNLNESGGPNHKGGYSHGNDNAYPGDSNVYNGQLQTYQAGSANKSSDNDDVIYVEKTTDNGKSNEGNFITINLGSGNDYFSTSAFSPVDVKFFDAGKSDLTGNVGVVINGGSGNDVIDVYNKNSAIMQNTYVGMGPGNDIITAYNQGLTTENYIDMADGNDAIYTTRIGSSNRIHMGAGDDLLVIYGDLKAGPSSTQLDTSLSSASNTIIDFGSGTDVLRIASNSTFSDGGSAVIAMQNLKNLEFLNLNGTANQVSFYNYLNQNKGSQDLVIYGTDGAKYLNSDGALVQSSNQILGLDKSTKSSTTTTFTLPENGKVLMKDLILDTDNNNELLGVKETTITQVDAYRYQTIDGVTVYVDKNLIGIIA